MEKDLLINVFGMLLIIVLFDLMIGFFCNGKCDICMYDIGSYIVCVVMIEEFFVYLKYVGNDLLML